MKTNITSLVEEALKEMKRPVHIQYHQENLKKILTTLAEKASRNGLQPLPEEMPDEIMVLIGNSFIASDVWKWVKGNFGIKPREWWVDLKPGDWFVSNGKTLVFRTICLQTDDDYELPIADCSPYTEPTALEQFMQSLTPEQIELAKRLKIEEGEG